MMLKKTKHIFKTPFKSPVINPVFLSSLQPHITGEIPLEFVGEKLLNLTRALTELELVEAEKLISFGAVWVNDKRVINSEFVLENNSFYRINPPSYGFQKFYEISENKIVFEDDFLLIYDKEAQRPSQEVPYDNYNNTHAALKRFKKQPLWLLHRLDADTSGLLMFAKNKKAAIKLNKDFQHNKIKKFYLALVTKQNKVEVEKQFTVCGKINKKDSNYYLNLDGVGKDSETIFTIKEEDENYLLILAQPISGRTHQIRLHLQFKGLPIVGDRFYGGKENERLMLKAIGLEFEHPETQKPLEIFI